MLKRKSVRRKTVKSKEKYLNIGLLRNIAVNKTIDPAKRRAMSFLFSVTAKRLLNMKRKITVTAKMINLSKRVLIT